MERASRVARCKGTRRVRRPREATQAIEASTGAEVAGDTAVAVAAEDVAANAETEATVIAVATAVDGGKAATLLTSAVDLPRGARGLYHLRRHAHTGKSHAPERNPWQARAAAPK